MPQDAVNLDTFLLDNYGTTLEEISLDDIALFFQAEVDAITKTLYHPREEN